MKKICFAFFVLGLVAVAFAEGTRVWRETAYEDFERGTARGVAIRSTGQLELAPAFKALYTSPSTFIWGIAADKDGTVYAATGAPARVYRITSDGKATVIFEPKELQVQAIALSKDGNAIYAATSPDGKVYKLTHSPAKPEYTAEPFFDPQTKYIWNLALDDEGRLYIATGDNGEIYRVDQTGHGSVFFKSDEAHIRVLAMDPKRNLIAGSDGSGLVYRITPAGEGFVLYSAPRKEITALAVDAAGNIYASGTGEKRGAGAAPTGSQPAPIPPPGAFAASVPFVGNVNLAGSDVFRIAPDGSPERLWSSREDVVYALALDASGRLVAGTGNKGRIYAIEKNGDFSDLLKASASQVTAFAKAPGGGLYCSSSNLGKVFVMSNTPEAEGVFESDVQDARIFSRWGRAEVRGRGNFELFARSGNVDNPDRNWSAWTRLDLGKEKDKDGRLEVPAARFVQWRAVLKPASPPTQIDEVTINYLPKNVAPVVDEVVVQVGASFQPQPHVTASETFVVSTGPAQPAAAHTEPSPVASKDRSSIAVRWSAHDENDDTLVYSLYYRGENEREWKLLKSGITDKFYSFDSGLLPDGGYIVKVMASDAPSHTPEEALTHERESQRFDIDNTPPRIDHLSATLEAQQLHVTFQAIDDYSPIKRAEYSVDAGDWQYLEPVGQISDAKIENYDFNAPVSPSAVALEQPTEQKRGRARADATPRTEHVVVVRVYDRYDNVATAKSVVR